MPIINVENAQIKTASVEIKTLTISGKQVTLSVFRQIKEEDILNYQTMTLNGIPWGAINYFWKDNGNEEMHYHLLWQREKELRRCISLKKVHGEFNSYHGEYNNAMDWFREDVRKINNLKYEISCIAEEDKTDFRECWIVNISCLMKTKKNIIEGRSYYEGNSWYSNSLTEDEKLKKLVDIERKIKSSSDKLSLLNKSLSEKIDALAIKENKCQGLLNTFKDLPHLFIAI